MANHLQKWSRSRLLFSFTCFRPSTLRDTSSSIINVIGGDAWYNMTVKNNTEHFEDGDYIISRLMAGVDFRAKNISSFDNLEKNAIDFYASVKSLYLQDRQQKY